jgi:hypothetical protein
VYAINRHVTLQLGHKLTTIDISFNNEIGDHLTLATALSTCRHDFDGHARNKG